MLLLLLLADAGRRQGASYLCPFVLIQAQPHNAARETLHVERVREELLTNHRIPAADRNPSA